MSDPLLPRDVAEGIALVELRGAEGHPPTFAGLSTFRTEEDYRLLRIHRGSRGLYVRGGNRGKIRRYLHEQAAARVVDHANGVVLFYENA